MYVNENIVAIGTEIEKEKKMKKGQKALKIKLTLTLHFDINYENFIVYVEVKLTKTIFMITML